MTDLTRGLRIGEPVWKPTSHNTLSVLLADTLLLLLSLFGVAQCFVSAFSLPADRMILTFGIVLFAGMFIAIFSLKRFVLPVLFILAAVYCGTAYWLRAYFLQGFIIAINRIMSELGSHSRFVFPLYRVDLPRGEYAEACTVFLIFLLFFLSCYLSWTIRRRHSFWLSFLGTAPFLLVPLGFTITPSWPSVLMLLAFWSTMLLSRLSANSSFGRTAAAGKVSLVALPAVLLGLLLLNILVPQEGYTRPQSIESLRTDLESSIYQSPFLRSGSSNSELGRANLSRSGNLQYTGKTVLRVKNPQKVPIYLHAFSSSIYTGTSWEPLLDTAYQKLEETLYFNPQNMAGQFFSTYAQPEETEELLMDVEIENIGANKQCVYAPYGLATRPEELSGGAFINDSYIRSRSLFGAKNYTLQAWNVPGFTRSVALDESPFAAAEQSYRQFANTHYTQLPQEIKMKLRWLCEQVGIPNVENTTQTEVVRAVADYVRSSGTYTLSPGNTPAGRDFVDYFLFENHKGYCVHFASAAVAMLRAQGIPARYAEGFAVTATDYGVDGWADIPDRRAHAWAEVYMPGLGWQPVEATPGVQLSTGQINEQNGAVENTPSSKPESELENEPESSDEPESEAELSSTLESVPSSSSPETTDDRPFSHLAAPVLLSISLVGGCILLLTLRRIYLLWRRKKHFHTSDGNQRALHLYRYLTQLAAFGESVDVQAENLALKAKFSQHRLTDEELQYLQICAANTAQQTYQSLSTLQKLRFKFWKCLI